MCGEQRRRASVTIAFREQSLLQIRRLTYKEVEFF